jgi:hypothetical protein
MSINNDTDIIENDEEYDDYEDDQEIDPAAFENPEDVVMMAPRIIGNDLKSQSQITTSSGIGVDLDIGKIRLRDMSPEDAFVTLVQYNCAKYKIDWETRNIVIKLAPLIPRIEYRSPVGIIFGVMAYSVRKRIDELNYIYKQAKEAGLESYDVIRYMRFIELNKLLYKIKI